MGNRFTERAQRSIVLAQEEAVRLGHDHVGTEHLLLGLLDLGEGMAVHALLNLGASLSAVQSDLERIAGAGGAGLPLGDIPFSAGAKTAMTLAVDESVAWGHGYTGTEHLLLGLMRVEDGLAARALADAGLTLDTMRREIAELLAST